IAHLDARLKFSTQTLLKEFATTFRSTILYVTHDYREALALSDHMAVLRKGRIEQEGTPYEIYNTPATDFVGNLIGEPPMNLIDGEVVTRDGKTLFNVGEGFSVPIREDRLASLKKVTRQEDGRAVTRLGVQLPVYAIVHETGSSVVTFELKGMFLYARTGEERSLCDYCLSEKVWLDLDQDHLFFYPKPLEAPKA
ncbi:MAG: ugpC 1, partial [Deltaproteobacteria bacterium]|nr:ugpC 1 [Deltaproteobacteria bacterium]